MRKILITSLCLAILLVAAFSAMADTIALGSSSGVATYAGVYVGPIQGTLNGGEIWGGTTCVDIASNSYFGTSWDVDINTLQPLDLATARYGSDATAIFQYQRAAWLLGQMPDNPTQVGEIQFAMWRIFDQDYVNANFSTERTADQIAIEDHWLALAGAINPANYNFSLVKIYTPLTGYTSNQEFMSGIPSSFTPVPVPPTVLLLGTGLVGLGFLRRKRSLEK